MGRLCCAFNQALKCYKFIWKDGCRRENVCCTAAVHEAVLMVQCMGAAFLMGTSAPGELLGLVRPCRCTAH